MKRLDEVLNQMREKNFSQENTPTSSSDSPGAGCALCHRADDVCSGLGVVRYDVPMGDPRWGKLFRCPHYPAEVDHDRQDRLRKLSNLDVFADKTFEAFETRHDDENNSLKYALKASQSFAGHPDGWLLLEGGYGCGKTHLAAAIGNARLTAGDYVLFLTSPDLLDYLRAAYSPDSESTYDETFDRMRNSDVLILDDLGVENPSHWAQEKLFQLLNHRYNHRLPTVITTNQHLNKLDPRIKSRLMDSQITMRAVITTGDYRSGDEHTLPLIDNYLNLYQSLTFETFEVSSDLLPAERDNLIKIYRAAVSYAEYHHEQWLWLFGKYGTGKTHLAAAIAHLRAQRGDKVMFLNVPDWLDRLRGTFSGKDEAEAGYMQRVAQVRNAPFLVLDDIGIKNPSAWASERLFQVLDYRYVVRLPTVLTSAGDLDSLGERILTRVLDRRMCTPFELTCRPYTTRRRL